MEKSARILNYRDLIVWQKSIEMVRKVYLLTRSFPREETYGLTQQIRRAAVSVPANIAEGHSRNGRKEFILFLGIAKGSLSEVQTHLVISEKLGFSSEERVNQIQKDSIEITKLLNSLLNSLSPKP